jgi:hypothetical protein
MGFWDNAGKALNAFSDAMYKKQDEIESKVRRDYEIEARNASVEKLQRVIRGAQEKGNYIAEEVARKELERRGYY